MVTWMEKIFALDVLSLDVAVFLELFWVEETFKHQTQ